MTQPTYITSGDGIIHRPAEAQAAAPASPAVVPEMGMTGNALAGTPGGAAPGADPLDAVRGSMGQAERDAIAAVQGGRGLTQQRPLEDDREAKLATETRDKANRDAFARLQQVLDDYGLGELADFVRGSITQGLSEAEITQAMRETESFKKRFPGIEERRKKGLPPISPGEYVAYERQARQLMRAAGLPTGFYDSNEDFTGLLVGDVSLSELGDRVTLASRAAFDTPPDALRELQRFGMTGGDLTAFWLDPDKAMPLLERKYGAARLSAAANRSAFGSLSEGEATELGQMGVTESQATQGFGNLVDQRELFGSLDRGEDEIGRDEQMDATFRGNAAARRRIEQRARRRQASFEGGGSFAAGQNGVSGLGSGPRV